MECFAKQKGNLKIAVLYFKYDVYFLDMLIMTCKDDELNESSPGEIEDLCKGVHVGQLPNPCTMAKPQNANMVDGSFVMNDEEDIANVER